MRSSTPTIIGVLRVLVEDIQSGDGEVNLVLAEAADRLEGLLPTPQYSDLALDRFEKLYFNSILRENLHFDGEIYQPSESASSLAYHQAGIINGKLSVWRDALEERDRFIEFIIDRNAASSEEMRELCKSAELEKEYFSIVANGKPTVEAHPTYIQRINMIRGKLEAAEKQLSEYNPPAKTKLRELTEDQGGIHIRDAKVLRFENGSECTIDAFGKINWITPSEWKSKEKQFWSHSEDGPWGDSLCSVDIDEIFFDNDGRAQIYTGTGVLLDEVNLIDENAIDGIFEAITTKQDEER